MKFTWFAVSSPTGKLKALLIIFNNCLVYSHFSAFKWEIVNYFVFFTVVFLGTYLFKVERAKYYDRNICTFWNQLLKCMIMTLSKIRRLQAYMPYFTLWDKISQNLAHLEANSHKIFISHRIFRPFYNTFYEEIHHTLLVYHKLHTS